MHLKQKPNFRVVEGEIHPDVDFEELKKDYLDSEMYVDDLLKKHNISLREYHRLRKRLVEETGVPVKISNANKCSCVSNVEKHISQDPLTLKYRVGKWIDGKFVRFGWYKTLDDAIRVRNVMMDHDWDKDYYIENIKPHYFTAMSDCDENTMMSEFKSDFMDGVPISTLLKKYGLTKYRYHQLASSVKLEYGLTRKPRRIS